MSDAKLKEQLLEEIERLSPEQLARVYEYAHTLVPSPMPRGATIDELMSLSGTIDDESARQMSVAIEEACERVDPSAW